jgi:uncharacterized damage-inducible protein DinB
MNRLNDDVQRLILRELQAFGREIALFPDDASLWRTVPGITNSAGTLAVHIAGNLQHFAGAVLGGSGYVRNREAEFGRRSGTRREIADELAAAERAVESLAQVAPSSLQHLYPAAPNGIPIRTQMFLLHLLAHVAFHLGQAGYIRRVVTGDARSADPLPLAALSD